MRWTFDDGGRTAAGFRGGAGDCVTRSVAIALALPYREVYDALHDAIAADRAAHGRARRNQRRSSPRTGVHTPVVRAFLADRGWLWTPTMSIGSGTTVHLRDGELPDAERLIARCSGHITAVIDGVVHDTHDPSRDGTRAVYGYWSPNPR